METELFWAQPHRRFESRREAKLAIFDYIEVFYNRQRRHTPIGSIPPVTYEQRHGFHGPDTGSMIHINPVATEASELQRA